MLACRIRQQHSAKTSSLRYIKCEIREAASPAEKTLSEKFGDLVSICSPVRALVF